MEKEGTRQKKTARDALLPIYDEVARCNKCGFCLSTCPVYTVTGEERAAARGHNVHLQNLIEGTLQMNEELKTPLFECLLCRACVENCMSGVKTHENVIKGRSVYMEQLGEPQLLKFAFRKLLPNPNKMDFYVHIAALAKKSKLDRAARALGLLKWFGRDRDKVLDLVRRLPSRFFRERLEELGPNPRDAKRNVAYFVGCGTNYALPDVGFSTVKTLRAAGCSVHILNNVCCGLPVSSYGDQEALRNLARRNLDIMTKLNVDAIVTECGSCGAFLKEYPDFFTGDPEYADKSAAIAPKLKTLCEYITEIDPFEFQGNIKARVTYHDPCHMSRYQNLVSEPREIIKRIPGVDYQELPEADWCCGAAGTYNIAHYGQSMQVLNRKMENVKKTKADILVTTCPACYIQLAYGVRKHGLRCEVLDLADLIARALKPPQH